MAESLLFCLDVQKQASGILHSTFAKGRRLESMKRNFIAAPLKHH